MYSFFLLFYCGARCCPPEKSHKKTRRIRRGVYAVNPSEGQDSKKHSTDTDDRVTLLPKGEISKLVQRVRIPHRGNDPSSARQLPILAALHARKPTLIASIIQHLRFFVKGIGRLFYKFLSTVFLRGQLRPGFCLQYTDKCKKAYRKTLFRCRASEKYDSKGTRLFYNQIHHTLRLLKY